MQVSDLQSRIYRRLGEDPAAPVWWSKAETLAALNWAQRLFCLVTLCLEDTKPFELTPGVLFYHMLVGWPEWIAPLRMRISNNLNPGVNSTFDSSLLQGAMFDQQQYANLVYNPSPKLKPGRMQDFEGYSNTWISDTGIPDRYGCLKQDLIFFNRATTQPGISILCTYARAPHALVNPTDIPDIPSTDQQCLADLAICILRLKEGGQELAKTKDLFTSFMEATKRRATQVRERSIAQQYDTLPLELERFDISRIFGIRPNLPPKKQEITWPLTSASK